MQKETFSFIILAAGKGTRMKSAKPKVLHEVAGKPIISHIIDKILSIRNNIFIDKVVIVLGKESKEIKLFIENNYKDINIVIQKNQLGTADAVLAAKNTFKNYKGKLIVLCGDTPLITSKLLLGLRELGKNFKLGLLGFKAINPKGYGRIVINKSNKVSAIIEDNDANTIEKKIDLCNSGMYVSETKLLYSLLSKVKLNSKNKEMYLTDIIYIANKDNIKIGITYNKEVESLGVNDRKGLAMAEKEMQNILREKAMKNGVTLISPETVFFSIDTKISKDVQIGPNVVFGPRVKIGEGVRIEAFCHLEGVTINKNCTIGPFARLRPGTILEESSKIGNFVEVKKSKIKKGAKVNHLSYVGDADVGSNVNIGAGVITCNYDGVNKNKTTIGNNSFVGSNVSLVAPLKVGSNALIGAGSVITKDVSNNMLAVERNKQVTIKKRNKK
ncbi:MAG: bifunctional UDP-N-acetylglucosamine diphosphorylase/glucosamine-1-phosphate N-acetyltransferase GlmU [Alphaproteobacteria bacterium]